MARGKKKQAKKFEIGPVPLGLLDQGVPDEKGDVISVLVFDAADRSFAIGIEQTEGVVDCPRVSPLPSAPDGLVGVASVRGKMTLVMDLSLSLNPNEGKWRLILVKGEAQAGLLAERVQGVVALDPKQLSQTQGAGDDLWPARAHFTLGDRRVPLIDLDRLVEV